MVIIYICVSNCVSNSNRVGVTVSLYLDERIKKKNNLFPVKLRVTHDRKRYYLSLDANRANNVLIGKLEDFKYNGRGSFSIDKATFDKANQQKPRGVFKELQTVFRAYEMEYQQLADSLRPFTIEKFKELYTVKSSKSVNDVFVQIENKSALLKNENRLNSASAYRSTLSSLKEFNKISKLSFDSITPTYLNKYKSWMLNEGKSETTVGIYLRSLRSVFNDAISKQITQNYPFYNSQNKSGFKIPSGGGRKIALSTEELKRIFDHVYDEKYPGLFYVDSWKLLYLLQGINPTDLCLLKFSSFQEDFIVLRRSKTTNSNTTEIKIPINDQIRRLLSLWANPETSTDDFIWPVFESRDPEEQLRKLKQFVKLINKYVKILAEELKITKKVTTYVTRHSYATQLMRHGAPVAFISKQLGHTNTKTTDNYLESFEDDQLKEWQKKISEF